MNSLLRDHALITLFQGTICFATVIGIINVYNKNYKYTPTNLVKLEESYTKCKNNPNPNCEKIKYEINDQVIRKILESNSNM